MVYIFCKPSINRFHLFAQVQAMASALAPRAELYRHPYPCGEYFERHQGMHPRGGEHGEGRVIGFPPLGGAVKTEDYGCQGTWGGGVDYS